jgi:pimeloyl-ACP methyl ester carboxylesterase
MGRVLSSLFVALAVFLGGCMHPPALEAPAGVQLTPIRSISPIEARVLLRLSGVKGIKVRHAVDCYRMEYDAVSARRGTVRLSGLLALPRGVAPRRLTSFQHGTTTTRTAVPSKPDGTGLAAAILFAGNGYALVVPDYPGLGSGPGRHPYYVAEEIAPAVADMIEAAQRVEGVPDTPVFLAGFSEGGWASLAALRLLEARGRPVLGSAQVAGAYDLRRISLPAALEGRAPQHALYLAYAAWGQADHYGQRLDSLLTAEHAVLVEALFSGAKPKAILEALPSDPKQMFNAQFLEAYARNGRHWFLDTFAENSLTDVTPRAPVRLYYGAADTDVVPQEAIAAAQAMRTRGAPVAAVNVGPVGHDASMLAAAPLILKWLDELEAAGPRR